MQEWTETEVQLAIEQGGTFCLYVYTPMCGTCQVASKILTVSLELVPQLLVGKMNLNFFPDMAAQYENRERTMLINF